MDSYHGLLLSIPSLSLSDESDELVCCLRSSSERDRIICTGIIIIRYGRHCHTLQCEVFELPHKQTISTNQLDPADPVVSAGGF